MEDEDFGVIELNGSHLKVFRDGRIHSFDKRCRKWNIRKSSLDNYGYYYLHIGKKFVKVHSVITLCYLGERNEGYVVDHINNLKTDNRLENLQYLTPTENQRKRLTMKGKMMKGYGKEGNKYKAQIQHLGTKIHLGMFKKEEDARQAYVDAKLKYRNVIVN